MYDLAIIGGGPAGYTAALEAAALGKKVVLIEKESLGGVCLHRGCIPTKLLLSSAKNFAHLQALAAAPFAGVSTSAVNFNLDAAHSYKKETISALYASLYASLEKAGVELVTAEAMLHNLHTIVTDIGDSFEAENIIIATGSSMGMPPIPGIDNSAFLLTSTELLGIKEVPESLTIIGAGAIGIEFASMFAMLGTKVTVLEMQEEILPFMDRELARALRRALAPIVFELGATVTNVDNDTVEFTKAGVTKSVTSEYILLAAGHRPNVNELGLENVGVTFDKHGIKVDSMQRTNVTHIYALGDVTSQSMFAHSAMRMAEIAVQNMFTANKAIRPLNPSTVPWIVYSNPEACGVGLTEEAATNSGREFIKKSMLLRASSRYLIEHGNRAPGMIKIIVDKNSRVILGMHFLGYNIGELIWGAAFLVEDSYRVDAVREVVFAHPTIGEIIKDCLKAF